MVRFAALAIAVLPALALAQAYPSKPIRLVNQFAAGASGDIALRIIAAPLSKSIGQPVVIDNRAGAGGVLAAETVIRSAPDGYTLLASSNALYIMRQFLVKDMSFDPVKDLTPITQYLDSFFVLVANPGFPPNSLKEMLDAAKQSPGKVNFGTSGLGTEGHLASEQIMELTGVKLLHVPYKAAAQALVDTVSGQLQTAWSTYSGALPHIRANKVKVLAVMREARTPRLPNVPTITEAVPGFEPFSSGVAIFGPAGVPAPIVGRLHSELAKAARDPEAQEKLKDGGFEALMSPPEEFAARMKREIALTGRLVKNAGIRPE